MSHVTHRGLEFHSRHSSFATSFSFPLYTSSTLDSLSWICHYCFFFTRLYANNDRFNLLGASPAFFTWSPPVAASESYPARPSREYAVMSKMKNTRGSRGRSGATDRGGIRKRGPTRTDREGDIDMDGGGGRGRGKRGRGGDLGRHQISSRPQVQDKTLNAIQQAITRSSDNQANIRQTRTGGPLEQISVRGWKQSRAKTQRDGGVDSLLGFLERKLASPDPKASSRAKITKVCATCNI